MTNNKFRDATKGKFLDETSRKKFWMQPFSKRLQGQAASEFVFTYGWMIFIAILGIGALFASGIVDLNSLMTTDQCNFPYGFTCVDYIMDTNQQIKWLIGNGLGYKISLNSISGDCNTITGLGDLDPNNQILLTLSCPNAPTQINSVFSARLTVNYTIVATNQTHEVSGRITTHTQ